MAPNTSTIADKNQPRISISERRATYPLQERLKIYCPDSMARRFSDQEKNQGKLIVNGVNILNKTSLDSDTMMHRIKQRRETHNRVERRRRDKLNGLVSELSNSIPLAVPNAEKCHRAKILRHAIGYIHFMQEENAALKIQLGHPVNTPVYPQVPLEKTYPSRTTSPSSESEITSSDNESQNCVSKKMNRPAFDTFCFQA
ncbi:hypothetical protein BCR42DRAFT_423235 [Absidia repens]|uniref:BHLH domain-containing protein n=1 Tax=Absidia repens TaxID=90262 RepID=A0A1X2I5J2_9FUNG|nr:hypothetical protein BCR42DRAFT_423235 [Absidia repens]